MGDEHLYYTFKHDTSGFIDQIKELLIQLESTGYSAEIINEMFRCVHSIKSEADYLGFTEIASAVNEMESAIEPLRNGEYGILPVNKLIDFCSAAAEKIDSLLSFTEPPVKETSEETGTRGGGKASCK
jgi:two-component system chemotaxis sensor kinase CheA